MINKPNLEDCNEYAVEIVERNPGKYTCANLIRSIQDYSEVFQHSRVKIGQALDIIENLARQKEICFESGKATGIELSERCFPL